MRLALVAEMLFAEMFVEVELVVVPFVAVRFVVFEFVELLFVEFELVAKVFVEVALVIVEFVATILFAEISKSLAKVDQRFVEVELVVVADRKSVV